MITRLKVVVTRTAELTKPGKLVFHPEEEVECLEIDGEFYIPTIQWLKYEKPESPKKYANEAWSLKNSASWTTLEDERELEKDGTPGEEDAFFTEGRPETD